MKKKWHVLTLLLCTLCLASAQASSPFEALTKRITDFAVMDGNILTCQNRYYTSDGSEYLETSIFMQDAEGERHLLFDIPFEGDYFLHNSNPIAVNGNTLYVLQDAGDNIHCRVMQSEIQGHTATTPVEVFSLEAEYVPQLSRSFFSGDVVWLIYEPYNMMYACNLSTGRVKKAALRGSLYNACGYKDGQLLCAFSSDQSDQERVVAIDPNTMNPQELFTYRLSDMDGPLACLAYDKVNDAIFAMDATRVYLCKENGELLPCGFLPHSSTQRNYAKAYVENGILYMLERSGEEQLVKLGLDLAGVLQTPLTIYDLDNGAAIRSFCLAHPEIPVRVISNNQTDSEIGQALVTGNGADIYRLNTSSSLYQAMIRKGYFVDMAENTAVRTFADGMFPQLAPMAWDGERLCGLPVKVNCDIWHYDPETMAALGLTPDDLPKSDEEMFDFILHWEERFGDRDSEAELFRMFEQEQALLLTHLLEEQAWNCQEQQTPMTFDTPEFRRVLDGFLKALPAMKQMAASFEGAAPRLFIAVGSRFVRGQGTPYLMPYISGLPEHALTSLDVYIINPASKHQKEATLFLEYLAENLANDLRYRLQPECCVPVQTDFALENIARIEKDIATAQKEIDTNGDTLGIWRDYMASFREDLASYQEENGENWEIMPSDVDNWFQVVDHIVPAPLLPTGLDNAMNRLLDGQLNADGFIREVERLVVMQRMENE